MKMKLLTAFAIACIAIAGCSSDREDASTADSNTIDTNMQTTDTTSISSDTTSMDTSRNMPDTTNQTGKQ